ncbi:MAG: ABC transporter permease [Oscillospiraceae bacterium]|nr:ABC transporter permease [Oscillospiraceae bacterium]
MSNSKLIKICALAIALYVIVAVSFYFISGDQLRYSFNESAMVNASNVVGEILSSQVLEQPVKVNADEITGLGIYAATYARENSGLLNVELVSDGIVIAESKVEISGMLDNSEFYLPINASISGKDKIIVRITAPESEPGNAITLYYGNKITNPDLDESNFALINGEELDGELCLRLYTRNFLFTGKYYWLIVAVVFLALIGCGAYIVKCNAAGKATAVVNLIAAFYKYKYLIKQLVNRDFKTKYKRSVLGVLWSFLNPLLTMSVQYVIFSTLFKTDIPNFVVYLLIGVVCFNFFSEATTMALSSIIGNAALITKVYVPKYIYPLTRVMSSAINFLLALIPLFTVVIITQTPFRASFLLLPLPIICLFLVCLGIGLLLSSSMVFFRDTQFLWGVLSMLWMYATPIFYPETIIPASIMPLFKCNPLYHIIRFMRIAIIQGVSPEPKAYGLMLLSTVIPLFIGLFVFKKTQDKFVLNI